MSSKQKTKKQIELLTTCFGWEEGHITEVLDEDEGHYYFDDEWGRWSAIEKTNNGIVFKIVGDEYPEIKCGGKNVTYNRLMRRAAELRKE